MGGLTEFRASLLASHGFAVLAVAYFAYEDLPNLLQEVDLEYFEEAANLLLAHPKVFKILFILPCNLIAKDKKIKKIKITDVFSTHFINLFRLGHSTTVYSYNRNAIIYLIGSMLIFTLCDCGVDERSA